ncbi:hypothetical protein SAMN05660443_1755 [Marinospirillum celere]|uniref:YcxB-like protein n=1 Tax=Marinospirillum celere TaxID=1122252 RepID=A0A1I1H2B2_9GAMM|nr:hypothetical protein [Marinospirillum celere]SFC17906.1 hypothetical protein SAMN05660443_1755 [Marinospirillum celere]
MKFTYQWDETQFLCSALYDYQLGAQKDRRQLFLWVVLIALTGVLAIKWLDQGFQLVDLIVVALGVFWFAIRKQLLVWMFKRAFRRSGQNGLHLSFTLDEEGLDVQVDQKPPQTYLWQDIHRVVRTEKGFLLYPGLLWLPFSGLEEEAHPEEAAALIQRKVNHYKDKSSYRLNLNL